MTAYSYEKTGDNFRVRDADDNRIATCWHEDNARFIVSRLNSRDELLAACKAALEFIRNGREFGYIRMPEPETPDSAHKTQPMLEAAIARAEATP